MGEMCGGNGVARRPGNTTSLPRFASGLTKSVSQDSDTSWY